MIWATEFLTTEIARSASPFSASTIPVVFSTALPAIPTTTIPANALRDPDLLHRRRQRRDEPVGDEGRPDPRDRQERQREPHRDARGTLDGHARHVRAEIVVQPDAVGEQQGDRADDRDRLDVVRGIVLGGRGQPDQHDQEAREQHQDRVVLRQARCESASRHRRLRGSRPRSRSRARAARWRRSSRGSRSSRPRARPPRARTGR